MDGVFAFTDLLAAGVLKGLLEADVRIPEDISVIGFSNWLITKMTSPTLSTVDQPGYEMGKQAFDLIYEEIMSRKNKTPLRHRTIELPTELIIRNSTR